MVDERREDWKHGVDENLASLNAGQRSQDSKLQKLEESQEEVDGLLHGETDSGYIGRIEDLETEVARLNAVIFQDAAGKKGLHHDIQMVLEGREDRRDQWGNLTKIAVAAIMSGLITHFWQDIRTYLTHKTNDPVDQMIERAEHPKGKHRHVVIREESEPETPEN